MDVQSTVAWHAGYSTVAWHAGYIFPLFNLVSKTTRKQISAVRHPRKLEQD